MKKATTTTAAATIDAAKLQNSNYTGKGGMYIVSTGRREMSDTRDFAALIGEELSRADALKDGIPETVGMFRIKSANQTMIEAQAQPDPIPLWLSLWYEGEVCCLFSDSNLGKSIYAVQIAASIAKQQRVLYFDFELSAKQFQRRYTDGQGQLFQFPEDFLRVEIDPDKLDTTNFEDAVIEHIEATATQTATKILIIDNLTYLCNSTEKGDAAGRLMMRLMALKKKYGFSLLVIAHTPKRNLSSPITTNDLAGSKKLFNFFDSCFAIGQSAKDSGLRYIKQMKVRNGDYTFNADNVIVCSIEQVGAFLQFVPMGYATEREHLKELDPNDKATIVEQVKQLSAEGCSQRQIRDKLGLSLGTVNNYLKK